MKHEAPTSTPRAPAHRGSTLDVYRVALELAALLHEPLNTLRRYDRELEAQARDALRSVVHNIAEGEGKVGSTRREQARYYAIARGSAHEVQGALDLCRIWRWMEPDTVTAADALLDRIRAMLYRLIARAA